MRIRPFVSGLKGFIKPTCTLTLCSLPVSGCSQNYTPVLPALTLTNFANTGQVKERPVDSHAQKVQNLLYPSENNGDSKVRSLF